MKITKVKGYLVIILIHIHMNILKRIKINIEMVIKLFMTLVCPMDID